MILPRRNKHADGWFWNAQQHAPLGVVRPHIDHQQLGQVSGACTGHHVAQVPYIGGEGVGSAQRYLLPLGLDPPQDQPGSAGEEPALGTRHARTEMMG